jgi:hypothetical protein
MHMHKTHTHTHTHFAIYITSHNNYKLHKTASVTSYNFEGPHEQHTRLHRATSSLLQFTHISVTHIIRLSLIKAKRVIRKHINSLQATSMKLSKVY